ncbi:MAG: hypothetical protein PHT56_05585 [Candidatus Izemoplasmatales bacterium]|jgi:hypothetical protein|nr:hypothetical protein [Candidatus Izemoplasmatales bacterium]MDY0373865.1 hypothetical protein [Candidatus Izemoplasmatales bacterium]
MMKSFFRRIRDAEFLPMSEVRKIKAILVLIFLGLMTAITIPFSIFFLDYSAGMKILFLVVFLVSYALITLFVSLNRIVPSIQISILYTIGLALLYTNGTNEFYAYLFFFISLSVIVFYQELYAYLLYATAVAGLGIYYILTHQASLINTPDIPGVIIIHIVILVVFYFVFLVQILYNEKLYTDMNYDWVKMNQVIDKYQEDIYWFLDEIRKEARVSAIQEDLVYQKVVSELFVFVEKQIRDSGKEFQTLFELYLYLHERDLEKILDSDEISGQLKKTATRLHKYLLNARTELFSLITNFYCRFRPAVPYEPNRYHYRLNDLTNHSDEQVIAIANLYQYLIHEVAGPDEWDQMKRVLSLEEVEELLTGADAEEFLTPTQMAFFRDNEELFREYLAKK